MKGRKWLSYNDAPGTRTEFDVLLEKHVVAVRHIFSGCGDADETIRELKHETRSFGAAYYLLQQGCSLAEMDRYIAKQEESFYAMTDRPFRGAYWRTCRLVETHNKQVQSLSKELDALLRNLPVFYADMVREGGYFTGRYTQDWQALHEREPWYKLHKIFKTLQESSCKEPAWEYYEGPGYTELHVLLSLSRDMGRDWQNGRPLVPEWWNGTGAEIGKQIYAKWQEFCTNLLAYRTLRLPRIRPVLRKLRNVRAEVQKRGRDLAELRQLFETLKNDNRVKDSIEREAAARDARTAPLRNHARGLGMYIPRLQDEVRMGPTAGSGFSQRREDWRPLLPGDQD